MFKIGKCGEQGGNEGQDDRGVTEDGGWVGKRRKPQENLLTFRRESRREMCALSSRLTTSVNALPRFPRFSRSHSLTALASS